MKRKMPSAAVIRANIWKNRYIYLMILPVVAYFAIIHYWAMGWLSISFYDFKLLRGFAGSKFVGLANFEKFISGVNFWPVIKNTLLLNFLHTAVLFPGSGHLCTAAPMKQIHKVQARGTDHQLHASLPVRCCAGEYA